MSFYADVILEGYADTRNSEVLKRHFERYCDWCWGHGYGSCDNCKKEYMKLYIPLRIAETVNTDEIRAHEKAKTIDEFLERVLHDNCEGKCPPDVMYCYKCVAMRVAKQMKEGNGNGYAVCRNLESGKTEEICLDCEVEEVKQK